MTERVKRTVGDACPYRKAPSGRELASVCETEGEREKRAGIQDFNSCVLALSVYNLRICRVDWNYKLPLSLEGHIFGDGISFKVPLLVS